MMAGGESSPRSTLAVLCGSSRKCREFAPVTADVTAPGPNCFNGPCASERVLVNRLMTVIVRLQPPPFALRFHGADAEEPIRSGRIYPLRPLPDIFAGFFEE
jgi:hypothetical protein